MIMRQKRRVAAPGIIRHPVLRRYCLLIVSYSMLFTGCATMPMVAEQLPLHRELASLPAGPVCRVAVLPFLNDSDFPLGEAIAGKVFATQLQELTDYWIIQDGDILQVYQQSQILPGGAPSLEQLQIVADRTKAQLLITGIVMEMREDRGQHGTVNPVLIMEVQIRDGRSGEALWTSYHRRMGNDYQKAMHFGAIHTVTGLSQRVAVEIINQWLNKGLTQCNASPRS
jgi:polysaccharide biosynthesis protein PelC